MCNTIDRSNNRLKEQLVNRIAHLAIQVTDVAAPGRLFEDVFGFSHTGTVVHPTGNFGTSGSNE